MNNSTLVDFKKTREFLKMASSEWTVKGFALIPVEINITVRAKTEKEAMKRAALKCESDKELLTRSVVPGTAEETYPQQFSPISAQVKHDNNG